MHSKIDAKNRYEISILFSAFHSQECRTLIVLSSKISAITHDGQVLGNDEKLSECGSALILLKAIDGKQEIELVFERTENTCNQAELCLLLSNFY